MIVEERTYTIHPEKMNEYLELYEKVALPIQLRCQNLLGYYRTETGVLNQLVHYWGYASMEDRAKTRLSLKNEPGWNEYVEKARSYFVKQESRILAPLPFSPKR